MQSGSERVNHSNPPNTVYTEPWWRSLACNNPISPVMPRGNTSNSSSLEGATSGSESDEDQSLSDGGRDEEDQDVTKGSQRTAHQQTVGNCGQEHQNMQHTTSAVPTTGDECLTQPQLELVGHSIACASNLYQDPYYAGMMAAYGHQPIGYPHYVGMPHARMPLPLEMAQEPVYVNAKQYQRILMRRQARAKAELEKKQIKNRKPYLHESRHKHAMRRPRGNGGRFAKKTDANALDPTDEEKGTGSVPAGLSNSSSPSSSEPLHSDSAETWNYSKSKEESRGSQVHDTTEAHNYVDGSGSYQNLGVLNPSVYHSNLNERGEEIVRSGTNGASPLTNLRRGPTSDASQYY